MMLESLQINWHFGLQVKQKQSESAADKQKHGAVGGDTDSIRTAILDEAVIVCEFKTSLGSKI